jgi:hypothetical protein
LAVEKAKEDYQRRYNAGETEQARKDGQKEENLVFVLFI